MNYCKNTKVCIQVLFHYNIAQIQNAVINLWHKMDRNTSVVLSAKICIYLLFYFCVIKNEIPVKKIYIKR